METPPLSSGPISSAATTAAAAAAAAAGQQPQMPPPQSHVNYADSIDSSPRSRNTDWDEPPPYAAAPGGVKLRLMCSYGGHIVPRPHDKSLCYVGGDTRIIVTDRHSSLSDLSLRLSKTVLNGRAFSLKYQLPNEDLDSLISVTTDEDLENMIDEYDRINSNSNGTKTSRLRLFMFPSKSDTMSSIGSLLESSTKSEDWFLNALNGATSTSTKVLSESSSVNCLLGLDDDIGNGNSTGKDAEAIPDGSVSGKNGGVNHAKVNGQDVHSVPDSPMLAMTSSFDSTSSSLPLGNLPPIRVRMEDNQRVGIEEHFSQMNIGVGAKVEQKQEEGGFAALTSPPAPQVAVGGEYPNRVYSDDERSEHGVPVGYSKPPHTQPPQQQQQHSQQPPQMQPKPPAPTDLPSPGSVSSEGSVSNPLSRPKHYIYQDPTMVQIQQGVRVSANPVDQMIGDPNSRAQIQQQVQDSGYFNQHPQLHQHQHQQYVQAGQYVHHIQPGAMPISSYYPVYPSQHHPHHPQHPALEHQYPVYFVQQPTPTQTYNLPLQQTNEPSSTPSTHPQTPPATTSEYNPPRNVPPSKPEMTAGSYRTAVAPQLVQVASGQHLPQYAGFTQIHHPSQSTGPTSAATGNYAYAFADPTHAQIYYTQPFAPQMSAQYQTMKSVPAGIPEASSQVPTENLNQHA